MASISTNRKGNRRILFNIDGKRKAVHVGPLPLKACREIGTRIDYILASKLSGTIDLETSAWLATIPDELSEKLSSVGLIPPRSSTLLGEFLAGFIASRESDTKPSTRIVYAQTRGYLISFFGENKPLREITKGDADAWRRWLIGKKGLADNTVRRRSGVAKQFFRVAMDHELISKNPFTALASAVRGNPDRMYFITRDVAKKVLEACPSTEWRLIFALARYGGLRTPSESLSIRWDDVDWSQSRMTIPSPKTEHHEGGASRVIPIFPELKPFLDEQWTLAPDGAEHVIQGYRLGEKSANMNLRTQLQRIIKRAGVEAWPKLFHNLRSSRQTELEEQFPSHVVCKWLGNSESVAKKHYLQVTDEHYEKAITNPPETEVAKNWTTQKPTRAASERAGKGQKDDRQETSTDRRNTLELQCDSVIFRPIRECAKNLPVGDEGLEYHEKTGQKRTFLETTARIPTRADEMDAVQDENPYTLDGDMEKVLGWSSLPDEAKERIAALLTRLAREIEP